MFDTIMKCMVISFMASPLVVLVITVFAEMNKKKKLCEICGKKATTELDRKNLCEECYKVITLCVFRKKG